MKMISLNEATASLAEYVQQSDKLPVVVTKRGKPVAALVSVSGVDAETLSLGTNPDFLALIERSRASIRQGKGISTEEMHRRVGIQGPGGERLLAVSRGAAISNASISQKEKKLRP